MNGDAFMLELFAGELRSNCATLKTAFSPDADSELLENAARSLKSSVGKIFRGTERILSRRRKRA